MSILSSVVGLITEAADTGTDVLRSGKEAVGIATDWVHHRSVAFKETDREYVLTEASKTLRNLSTELAADAELSSIHDKLAAKWKW